MIAVRKKPKFEPDPEPTNTICPFCGEPVTEEDGIGSTNRKDECVRSHFWCFDWVLHNDDIYDEKKWETVWRPRAGLKP